MLGEKLLDADMSHTLVLTSVLTAIAQISMAGSRFEEALGIHERIGRLALAADEKDLLAESLQQQAFLHRLLGKGEQARPLLAQAETIYREGANLDGIASVLDERAKLHVLEGDLQTALKPFREIAGLYQQLNQPLWLGACYDEQARIHCERDEFDLAVALFVQERAIYVRHGNLSLLRWSLGNEAEMLLSRGDIPGALVRLEHAEQLCREMQTPDQLAQTLDRQAHHRTDINELDKAMEQLLEAESIYRSTLQNDMLLASNLLSQATILEKQERY
jgi:tetratricopeptide (TPR) repeat protein